MGKKKFKWFFAHENKSEIVPEFLRYADFAKTKLDLHFNFSPIRKMRITQPFSISGSFLPC